MFCHADCLSTVKIRTAISRAINIPCQNFTELLDQLKNREILLILDDCTEVDQSACLNFAWLIHSVMALEKVCEFFFDERDFFLDTLSCPFVIQCSFSVSGLLRSANRAYLNFVCVPFQRKFQNIDSRLVANHGYGGSEAYMQCFFLDFVWPSRDWTPPPRPPTTSASC